MVGLYERAVHLYAQSTVETLVRVAGVEPAWTCSQGMWVAATLHPDFGEGPSALSRSYPFTQTTWRNVCTTSTRSRCASITASMDLYAIGVSSMTSASLRHSTPAVAFAWSSSVKRRFASARDMARPAPWLQLMKLSGLPLPRTMYERAPMLPGMIPMSPSRARTAPLRVTSTFWP